MGNSELLAQRLGARRGGCYAGAAGLAQVLAQALALLRKVRFQPLAAYTQASITGNYCRTLLSKTGDSKCDTY